MKTISYLGACLCDNMFYYAIKREKGIYYSLKNRWFQISPFSLLRGESIEILEEYEVISPWEMARSSIKTDIRNDLFELMRKKKTEWLIVETGAFSWDILELEENGAKKYLTYSIELRRNINQISNILEKNNIAYTVKKISDYENVFEETVDEFFSQVLEVYSEDRIILFENAPASYMRRPDGTLDLINVAPNSYNARALEFIKNKYKKIHVVDVIYPLLADANHYMGPAAGHYVDKFYEYLKKAIDIITDEMENEKISLNDLKNFYSIELQKIQEEAMRKTLKAQEFFKLNYSYELSMLENGKKMSFLQVVRKNNCLESDEGLYIEATSLNDYVKRLVEESKDYVLFGVVCNSANRYWEKWTNKALLGITTEKLAFRNSYIFVADIKNKRVKELYDHSANELFFDMEIKSVVNSENTNIFSNNGIEIKTSFVKLRSKGLQINKKTGMFYSWGKIIIDNIEYSINRRGLNLVLFDKKAHRVMDSFYVDIWADAALTICRNL